MSDWKPQFPGDWEPEGTTDADRVRSVVVAAHRWSKWRVADGGVELHETEHDLFNAVLLLVQGREGR